MINTDSLGTMEDFFANVLVNRPSDVVDYSIQYFESERTDQPKVAHAYRSLRHLVYNSEEFRGAVCAIFCDELVLVGDAEADEITVKVLGNCIKRLLETEARSFGGALDASTVELESVLTEHVPVDGTVSFNDFVAYMRFVAGNIAMRAWLHRVYLFSAELDDGERLPHFNVTRLKENLNCMPVHLCSEGNVDTRPWVLSLSSTLSMADIADHNMQSGNKVTPDELFSSYLRNLVQRSLALRS